MKYTLLVFGGAMVHFLMLISQEVTRVLEVTNNWFVAKFVAMKKSRDAAKVRG